METLHLPTALCAVSRGPALLDTKGRAQLLYQGGREVCPPVTQQLSGCSKDRYEVLIEHLHNRLSHLVLCHHSKGIPHEIVGHHKDIFYHGGAYSAPSWTQYWCNQDAQAPAEHTLESDRGKPLALSLKCLAVQASPHYSSAILCHHGPPESLLSESQGPLLALMAGISVYPIKRHVALSHGDDEG